jgi:hypothetical protein
VLLDRFGVVSFPWVLLALLLISFSIALNARVSGFPAGARHGNTVVAGH